MAGFNEILAGRFNRALQKLLSMKGPPPTPSLSGEFTPALIFQLEVTEKFLEGWELFGLETGIAAQGVGNLGGIQIRNPLTSGVIAVVQKVSVSTTALDQFTIGYTRPGTDLVGASPVALDTRGRPAGALIVSLGTAAAFTASLDRAALAANANWNFIQHERQAYVVNPGTTFGLQNSTVNQAINGVSFLWWERALEDSEKQ